MKTIQKYHNKSIALFIVLIIFLGCTPKEKDIQIKFNENKNTLSINNLSSESVFFPKKYQCNQFNDSIYIESLFKSEDGVIMAVYDFKIIEMYEITPNQLLSVNMTCKNKDVILIARIYSKSFGNYLKENSKPSSQNLFKKYEKEHSFLINAE